MSGDGDGYGKENENGCQRFGQSTKKIMGRAAYLLRERSGFYLLWVAFCMLGISFFFHQSLVFAFFKDTPYQQYGRRQI